MVRQFGFRGYQGCKQVGKDVIENNYFHTSFCTCLTLLRVTRYLVVDLPGRALVSDYNLSQLRATLDALKDLIATLEELKEEIYAYK